IKLTPTNASLYFNAGLALKQLKDYSEAMLMFKISVEIDPQNVSAHRQLAAVSALGLISGDVTA
ncbi:MAG: tetratricopeptide repeat protein, partial [Anaerolineales bacterium]|nr:tetratricopeptide repeat protein [Anaerolineales bacterium]